MRATSSSRFTMRTNGPSRSTVIYRNGSLSCTGRRRSRWRRWARHVIRKRGASGVRRTEVAHSWSGDLQVETRRNKLCERIRCLDVAAICGHVLAGPSPRVLMSSFGALGSIFALRRTRRRLVVGTRTSAASSFQPPQRAAVRRGTAWRSQRVAARCQKAWRPTLWRRCGSGNASSRAAFHARFWRWQMSSGLPVVLVYTWASAE